MITLKLKGKPMKRKEFLFAAIALPFACLFKIDASIVGEDPIVIDKPNITISGDPSVNLNGNAVVYVGEKGKDEEGYGTLDRPFLTVGYAHKRVRPNTTIMVMNSINIINRAEFIYPCV